MVLSGQHLSGLEVNWVASLDPWETCVPFPSCLTLSDKIFYICSGFGQDYSLVCRTLTLSAKYNRF